MNDHTTRMTRSALGVSGTVPTTSRRSAGISPAVAEAYKANITPQQLDTLDLVFRAVAANRGAPAPVSIAAVASKLHVTQAQAIGIIDTLVRAGHLIANKQVNSAILAYSTSVQSTRKSDLGRTLGVKSDINITINVVDGNSPKRVDIPIPTAATITGTNPAPAALETGSQIVGKTSGPVGALGGLTGLRGPDRLIHALRSAGRRTTLDNAIGAQPAPVQRAVAPRVWPALPGTMGQHVRKQRIAAPVLTVNGLPADDTEIDPQTGRPRIKS